MFNHGLTHRLLNLALSGDAELSEQLSDARVEDVFLHRAHLRSLGYRRLARRPIKRAPVHRAGHRNWFRSAASAAPSDVREPTLSIVCEPCSRRGCYNVERLMAVEREAGDLQTTLAGCRKAHSGSHPRPMGTRMIHGRSIFTV
jgi:hypothetical protein